MIGNDCVLLSADALLFLEPQEQEHKMASLSIFTHQMESLLSIPHFLLLPSVSSSSSSRDTHSLRTQSNPIVYNYINHLRSTTRKCLLCCQRYHHHHHHLLLQENLHHLLIGKSIFWLEFLLLLLSRLPLPTFTTTTRVTKRIPSQRLLRQRPRK